MARQSIGSLANSDERNEMKNEWKKKRKSPGKCHIPVAVRLALNSIGGKAIKTLKRGTNVERGNDVVLTHYSTNGGFTEHSNVCDASNRADL